MLLRDSTGENEGVKEPMPGARLGGFQRRAAAARPSAAPALEGGGGRAGGRPSQDSG